MRMFQTVRWVFFAAIVAAILTGCCCSDRAKCDQLHAETPAQAKLGHGDFRRYLFVLTCYSLV